LELEASPLSPTLRQEYEAASIPASSSLPARPRSLRRRRRFSVVLSAAQRQALMDLRARDIIGDAAFQAAEEELICSS